MAKISKWGWIGDRGEHVLTITGYEQLTANRLRCSQLAVCSAITRLQSLVGRGVFLGDVKEGRAAALGTLSAFLTL